MINEFIPYNLALELKELGFDEPTSFYWENNVIRPLPMKDEVGAFHFNRHARTENEWICAPLYQQAFRWFRQNNIDHSIVPMRVDDWHMYQYVIFTLDEVVETGFDTYEEAELACLTKLIEIVKTK